MGMTERDRRFPFVHTHRYADRKEDRQLVTPSNLIYSDTAPTILPKKSCDTSKFKVAEGGIVGGLPRSPYA